MDLPRSFGRYHLLDRLGEGASAQVFLARTPAGPAEPVVVKIFRRELLRNDSLLRRFHHEAMLAVAVDSPQVAKVHEIGRVEDEPYVVMEYVPGWTLTEVLREMSRERKPLPLPFVGHLAQQATAGLGALHEAKHPESQHSLGIVHRDLSPNNLMLRPSAKLCLIDLGLGKSRIQDWKTQTGMVMGSLGFMAPEQAVGDSVGPEADQYALALVLWELLVLRPYISRQGARIEILRRTIEPEFVPPSRFRPEVPQALDAVFAKALDLRPDRRFPDVRTFGQAFVQATEVAPSPRHIHALRRILDPELEAARTRVESLMQSGEDPQEDRPTQVIARRPFPSALAVDPGAAQPTVASVPPPAVSSAPLVAPVVPTPGLSMSRAFGVAAVLVLAAGGAGYGLGARRTVPPSVQTAPRSSEPSKLPAVQVDAMKPRAEPVPSPPLRSLRPPAADGPKTPEMGAGTFTREADAVVDSPPAAKIPTTRPRTPAVARKPRGPEGLQVSRSPKTPHPAPPRSVVDRIHRLNRQLNRLGQRSLSSEQRRALQDLKTALTLVESSKNENLDPGDLHPRLDELEADVSAFSRKP